MDAMQSDCGRLYGLAVLARYFTTLRLLFLVVLLAARGFSGTDHVDGHEPEEE